LEFIGKGASAEVHIGQVQSRLPRAARWQKTFIDVSHQHDIKPASGDPHRLTRMTPMNFDQLQVAPVPQVLVGLVLVLFGRKLFWLFVGVVGFLAGMRFGAQLVTGQPQIVMLAIALGVGLLAAVLAIVLQRVAVALAGGLAGGMLAMQIAVALGVNAESTGWIFFVIGAVLAAILVSLVFDWALIILSALIGASIISDLLPFDPFARLISTIALFMLGAIVQSRLFAPVRA
jgi:hypothetical protein